MPPESKPAARSEGLIRRPPRLVDEVYDTIYRELMSLKIPPNGRISVDNLVRELGVSQTPIREALSRLEAQGLVVKTHLVGYSAATQLDRKRLEDSYELRLLLEPFAAKQAALLLTDADISLLESIDNAMQAIEGPPSRQSYSEFARMDSEFHNLISQLSGNQLVHEALSRLHIHVHLFRTAFHSRATTDANDEHRQIIQRLKQHDADGAGEAMREHVLRSKARFLTAFGE